MNLRYEDTHLHPPDINPMCVRMIFLFCVYPCFFQRIWCTIWSCRVCSIICDYSDQSTRCMTFEEAASCSASRRFVWCLPPSELAAAGSMQTVTSRAAQRRGVSSRWMDGWTDGGAIPSSHMTWSVLGAAEGSGSSPSLKSRGTDHIYSCTGLALPDGAQDVGKTRMGRSVNSKMGSKYGLVK